MKSGKMESKAENKKYIERGSFLITFEPNNFFAGDTYIYFARVYTSIKDKPVAQAEIIVVPGFSRFYVYMILDTSEFWINFYTIYGKKENEKVDMVDVLINEVEISLLIPLREKYPNVEKVIVFIYMGEEIGTADFKL